MGYAFISYSSTDREFVTKFAKELKQAKCEVWFDRWNITGREPYWDEIQSGIEGCSHFVFVISPDSISSTSGARKELYHASGLKSPPTIIPIMGRETPFDKLPILISPGEFQIHDFVHQPFDEAFEQVLNAIQAAATDTVGRRAALRQMTSVLPAVKAPEPVAPTQVPPARKSPVGRRLIVAAAILVALIAIGIVLVASNQSPGSAALANTETATSTTAATATPGTPASTVAATSVAIATEAGITMASTESVVSMTPASAPDASLMYDGIQVVIMNVSKRTLNVTQLDFVQSGSTTRSLGTSQWHQPNSAFAPEAMPPSACFQIARSGLTLPDTLKACRPRTWTQVGSTRWFWIAQDNTVSTFDVRLNGKTIQTCQIKAGQCDFALP